jgi:hypothetical protein
VDCPGSTGIGVDVLWSGGYTAIPAASALADSEQDQVGLW